MDLEHPHRTLDHSQKTLEEAKQAAHEAHIFPMEGSEHQDVLLAPEDQNEDGPEPHM